jgi:hypothetical protein
MPGLLLGPKSISNARSPADRIILLGRIAGERI